MNKPVLITGGCGFVGRNLIRFLIQRKTEEIWVIDNLSTGKHPDIWLPRSFKRISQNGVTVYQNETARVNFVNHDLIDVLNAELQGNLKLPSFSDVFHLASIVGGRELIDGDPILVAKDLAIDSIFFLWATRNSKNIGRILYASSSAAYPITLQTSDNHVPLSEREIDFTASLGMPDMTYGWSKLTGEYLSRLAAKKYGLRVACVRPFSGYGYDQDLSYPIPAIAKRVALREDPLTVWGSGKQGRDFVYIDDCIEAFFVIMDKVKDGSGVNIGTGKILSFIEVLNIFSRLEGYQPAINPLIDKPVGVSSRYANTELIDSFGWKPKISIEEGFARCLIAAKNIVMSDFFEVKNKKSRKREFDKYSVLLSFEKRLPDA